MNIIGSYWNLRWRRCIGIEPIYDSISAARAGLKSGASTSDASISVNNNSDLWVCDFLITSLYENLYANYPYNFLETDAPVSSSRISCMTYDTKFITIKK